MIDALERYPDGVPDKVRTNLTRKLALIAELDHAAYFLTVHGIVRFACADDKLELRGHVRPNDAGPPVINPHPIDPSCRAFAVPASDSDRLSAG